MDALLLNEFPSHPEAIGFHASVLAISGQSHEAIAILERLKKQQTERGAGFPQAGILAECYYQVGQFEAARSAYQTAFDQTPESTADRFSLAESFREFQRETEPRLQLGLTFVDDGEGSSLETEVSGRLPAGADISLGATYRHREVDAGKESGEDALEEIHVVAEKSMGAGYYIEGNAGAVDDEASYGIELGKRKRALEKPAGHSLTPAENQRKTQRP